MTVRFTQHAAKPKLRQFSTPLFHTLLGASSVYIAFHVAWLRLEHREEERKLLKKSQEYEDEIQKLVSAKSRRWWFW
ncbi:hypothetical protein JA9_004867 [Meyerozyma sp. JA9]|nr:hypothetical protein JA9_004867 [Meyerozyma sp. JA9]